MRVYVGTYTRGVSKGIYLCEQDASTGALHIVDTIFTEHPSFLALHPSGRFLYAVNEMEDGWLSAFAVYGAGGQLSLINRQPALGAAPCHLCVDRSGACVVIANYSTGSVVAFPIRADGGLEPAGSVRQHVGSGPNLERQEGPHAHSADLTPDNALVVTADLGLDRLMLYRLDTTAALLMPHDPPFVALQPGCGPRHLAFHPNGRFAYVITELANTVVALTYDATRRSFEAKQTVSTLPAGWTGESYCAEICVHPSGRFVYGSNRGHDSIAIFAVDEIKGTLTPAGHAPTLGHWPRNFAFDPTGRFCYVANERSDSIVIFRVDATTGALTPTGHTLEVPSPVCVLCAGG
ncbi:MAG: lactonase family protein [Anaerolineae bacterium]|nr:lactonase family protein [Thermoflexales bacterium]MDW8407098.1 lactonase family protein [Anaerolineae bacterium]